LSLLLAVSARAETSPSPAPQSWKVSGEARLSGFDTTRFVDDGAGHQLDPGWWATSRLIAGVRYTPAPKWELTLELEGLNGHLFGETTKLGTVVTPRPFPVARNGPNDLARVLPRKAFVAWTTPVGVLTAGAQTFTWGTGMISNDGAGDEPFGDSNLGNIVARLAFATRPLQALALPEFVKATAIFVAGDFVLRDDSASIYDGDTAFAGVLGLRATAGDSSAGFLASVRNQVDRPDPYRPGTDRAVTTVVVLDGYGRQGWAIGGDWKLGVEAEVAGVLGHSTRPWSDATYLNGSAVSQLGGLARLRLEDTVLHSLAILEGGYASGDNDPRDAVSRTFTMHTDHNVGLILFDQVLPLLSARGVDRISDASLVAQPAPGTRFAINPGAVQNAVYGTLVLRSHPVAPLDVRVGYLFATPAADLIDAYQTGIHGGFPTSAGGKVQWRGAYGQEVDARASWTFALPPPLELLAGLEGGVFFPGAAFDGVPGLKTLGLGKLTVSLHW
jgi:hypothetical protein